MWSWREFYFTHCFKNGVIADEYGAELSWARGRKLSCVHAFGDPDDDADVKAVDGLIGHYGLERVSKAKDWYSFYHSFI